MGSRLLRVLVLVLGLPAVAWGQVRVAGSATPTAIDVACVSGCVAGGGVTDADDGSVAGGQTVGLGIGLGYGFDGSVWRRISLFGLAGANAQAVAIVDGTGTQITSFGGGTQYVNGVANAGPTGTLALGYDGANLRAQLTNASGHQYVIFPSAQSVTATNSFLLDATFTGRINTLGQKTMVNSTPVVIASDQTSIQVAQGVSPFNENVSQISGNATAVNSGNKDNGTLRVVLATDQPQLTNKLLVTPDANSAVNVAQVGGTVVSALTTAPVSTEAGMPVRPITRRAPTQPTSRRRARQPTSTPVEQDRRSN
jgi:hypothetical protein